MKDDFKDFVDNYKKDPDKVKQKNSRNQNEKKTSQGKIYLTLNFGNGWVE